MLKAMLFALLAGMLVIVMLAAGSGGLDFDGSNAAAQARAESAAEQARLQQIREQAREAIAAEQGHTERVIAIENAHTERLVTILAFFKGDSGASSNGIGTNHNGGISVGAQAGAGIGWPFLLIGGLLILGGYYLYGKRQR